MFGLSVAPLFAPALTPTPLEGQTGQVDGLGRPDGGTAHGIALLMGVEEPGDHVHTAVVDFRRLGVLVGVDEIAAEGLDHYLVGFRFHPRGDETGQVKAGFPSRFSSSWINW